MIPSSQAEIPGYPDYSQIEEKLHHMNETYPGLCSLYSIGTTYEGRTIWAIKISDHAWKDEKEPAVLIMGEHHAKELISGVIPLMFAESLLQNYSHNSEIKGIVDSNEIWIVPVVNPDGYEYAWEGHTDWRKNRRPIDADGDGSIDGIGVDLNRNYAHHWGKEGTTHDIRNDAYQTYCGPHPFSENETKAIRELVLSHNFTFSVSFHSYGQRIYHPWGNLIDMEPMDADLMEAVAGRMAGYNLYHVMEGNEAYATTGDSDDWIYANTSCLPFTIELGKKFIPQPGDIKQIFDRNRGALLYLLSISDNPYLAVSEEETNLRITNMSVAYGNATLWVENQGNYSVSAEICIRSEISENSTDILLTPHEKKELYMRIEGMGPFTGSIHSIHHASEWNETDNYARYEYLNTDEKGENGFQVPIWLELAAVLGISAYLLFLFKKNKLH
jgi:carboxypeptidase T